jgi:hypothetical protein
VLRSKQDSRRVSQENFLGFGVQCYQPERVVCKLLKRWWTWSGSVLRRVLIIRNLLILRMARRPKMPTLPGRLYDFCTVNFPNRFYSDPPSSQSFLPVISLPKHSLEIHSILVPLGRSDQENSRFSPSCRQWAARRHWLKHVSWRFWNGHLSPSRSPGSRCALRHGLGKAQVSFVVVFRKTRSSLLLSTPAKWGRPSPLKSAVATACAPVPLGTSK